MACVYAIKNKATGWAYIGSTANLRRRWKEHRTLLAHNKHYSLFLQDDWNQYGSEGFEWTVLQECNEADMVKVEREWLLSTEKYYNQHTDPRTKWQDPEFREMMRQAAKKRYATENGRTQLKAARANRADYSMMSYVRSHVKNNRNQYPPWTEYQISFLKENYGRLSSTEISKVIGKSPSAIRIFAQKNGIKFSDREFSNKMRDVAKVREAEKRKSGGFYDQRKETRNSSCS